MTNTGIIKKSKLKASLRFKSEKLVKNKRWNRKFLKHAPLKTTFEINEFELLIH